MHYIPFRKYFNKWKEKFCSEIILYTQNWNRLGISPRHALHFTFGEAVRNVHICIFLIYAYFVFRIYACSRLAYRPYNMCVIYIYKEYFVLSYLTYYLVPAQVTLENQFFFSLHKFCLKKKSVI